jgi:hypothetical protein
MATWATLRSIARALPELEEQSPRDWRVRNKMVVWERPLRPADLDALGDAAPAGAIIGVRVSDEGVKHALIADNPGVYFTTPHFDGYAAVLVRLSAISRPELEEIITEAWLDRAPRRLARQWLGEDTSRHE